MKDMLIFVYSYYGYYFYLGICVFFGFISFLNNRRRMTGIKAKCIALVIGFILEAFFSVIMTHVDFVEKLKRTNHPWIFDMMIKIVCCIVFSIVLIQVIIFIGKYAGELLKRNFIRENQYGLIIGAVTFVWLIINLPTEIAGYCSVWYAADYSMGLSSRFFIGTLLNLFYDDFLDRQIAYHFCVCALAFIIIIVSCMLNKLIKKAKEEYRPALLFLVLCFMASPGYIRAFWQPLNIGRLETYTFFLALVSVVLFESIGNIYLKYGCITILSCISMAIYQGDLFLYYPMTIMIIVYDGLTNHDKVIARRILGIINILCTGIAFVVFQFFSYTIFSTPQDMIQALSKKTNLNISSIAIRLEMFEPVTAAYNEVVKKFLSESLPRERTLLTMCLMVPIVLIILSLYMKCIENQITERKQFLSKPYMYYILLEFAVLPQFLLNVDWGRWMLAFNIVMFFGVFYLAYKQDQGMLYAVEKLSSFIRRNSFMVIIIVIYLATLGNYEEWKWIPPVDSIMYWIDQNDFFSRLLIR